MLEPCNDDHCRGKLHVIRSRYYRDERTTKRVKKCDVCARKIVTRETITNGNASSTYLPAPKPRFEPSERVLTRTGK